MAGQGLSQKLFGKLALTSYFISLFIYSSLVSASGEASHGEIQIQLPDVPENTSGFLVNIYLSRESFLKKPDLDFYVPLEDLESGVILLKEIPHGQLTLSIAADTNGNKKLDTRIFGIPAEPVGFVNNPRPKFGPPSFKQCLFTHDKSPSVFTVKLKEI